jgi:hypothetical protein
VLLLRCGRRAALFWLAGTGRGRGEGGWLVVVARISCGSGSLWAVPAGCGVGPAGPALCANRRGLTTVLLCMCCDLRAIKGVFGSLLCFPGQAPSSQAVSMHRVCLICRLWKAWPANQALASQSSVRNGQWPCLMLVYGLSLAEAFFLFDSECGAWPKGN